MSATAFVKSRSLVVGSIAIPETAMNEKPNRFVFPSSSALIETVTPPM